MARLTRTSRTCKLVNGHDQRHLKLTRRDDGSESLNLLSTVSASDRSSLMTMWVEQKGLMSAQVDMTIEDLAELYQELRVLFEMTDPRVVA